MEKFEFNKKNKHEASIYDRDDEDIFKDYIYLLDMKPEDFEKVILDIGSGSGRFAKWAKEHNLSKKIFSVDDISLPSAPDKFVFGRAEELPFANQSIDLILSLGAIPNSFASTKDKLIRKDKIKMALEEMLRVLRPEGEIRLAPLTMEDSVKFYYLFVIRKELLAELAELAGEKQIEFEEKKIGKDSVVKIKKITS